MLEDTNGIIFLLHGGLICLLISFIVSCLCRQLQLVFLKGNNGDGLSLYIQAVDSTKLPYGCNIYAKLSLAVVNQVSRSFDVQKGKPLLLLFTRKYDANLLGRLWYHVICEIYDFIYSQKWYHTCFDHSCFLFSLSCHHSWGFLLCSCYFDIGLALFLL